MISDSHKAKLFEAIVTKIYYASITGNNESIRELNSRIKSYGGAGLGEYTDDESEELRRFTYVKLSEFLGVNTDGMLE